MANWSGEARTVLGSGTAGTSALLPLVQRGMRLRCQADLAAADAPQRREILVWLTAARHACREALIVEHFGSNAQEAVATPVGPPPQIPSEEYLEKALDEFQTAVERLSGAAEPCPPEIHVGAVEALHDDLYWLEALFALPEDLSSHALLGHVLAEEENLHRRWEAWRESEPARSAQTGGDAVEASVAALHAAAWRLQAERLLQRPWPVDAAGWFRRWHEAGRLLARADPQTGILQGDSSAAGKLHLLRDQAEADWRAAWKALSPEAQKTIGMTLADELIEDADEALTFLEDVAPSEGVETLEVLSAELRCTEAAFAQPADAVPRPTKRRLRRTRKLLEGEHFERRLAWRMEGLFGHRAVAALERLVLGLLLVFVLLLALEHPLTAWAGRRGISPHSVTAAFAWFDLGICLVFLMEFSLKMALAQPPRRYLARHWITGLLPAIPFGFMAYAANHPAVADSADLFVLLRLLRYARLPQMARWLRIARPLVQTGRVLAFLLQASDRLMRRLAPLVNRNLVLFETAALTGAVSPARQMLLTLRDRCGERLQEAAEACLPTQQGACFRRRADDLAAMLEGLQSAGAVAAPGTAPVERPEGKSTAARDLTLEEFLNALLTATPARVAAHLGRSTAERLARWCRALNLPLIRRLPVLSDLVEAGRCPDPLETVAAAGRRLGGLGKRLRDRLYWFADFYGIVTSPQAIDSLGAWLIRGTASPARRFLMFGLGFAAVSYLAGLLPLDPLKTLSHTMERTLGAPLIIIGILCMIPLLLGMWFRQIAGEASDFLSRVAEAQFLTAAKAYKRQVAARYEGLLHARVVQPEAALRAADPGCPAPPAAGASTLVEDLWEDYLDGAPFHPSDTKIATQLLGNLTLIAVRRTRLRYDRKRRKKLQRLDLAAARASLRGPYVWFHFLCRSLAQNTAKLVVEYNRHALPLARAETVDEATLRRYAEWLARRLGKPRQEIPFSEPFRARLDSLSTSPKAKREGTGTRRQPVFQTNDFTAVCFFTRDARLEDALRRDYGDLVVDLMLCDRRDNFRRVFRTYPFHRRPVDQRTVNLLAFYQRHFEGGRVLLVPLKLTWWGAKGLARLVRLVLRIVREVLAPTAAAADETIAPDSFGVALRKIHRMRKPIVLECLRMRAEFDPEYLGISLPGCPAAAWSGGTPLEEDLRLLDAEEPLREEFGRLVRRRRQQLIVFRQGFVQPNTFAAGPEALRAMAVAYAVDHQDIRRLREASRRLQTLGQQDELGRAGARGLCSLARATLRTLWRHVRYRVRFRRLFELPPFAAWEAPKKAALRRRLCRGDRAALRDLKCVTRRGTAADPESYARDVLRGVARDPQPWSRQLLTLRAVQTLSILDLKIYADLTAELGEYESLEGTEERG